MSTLKIKGTRVLHDILANKGKKVIVLEGGSRSSKTFSVFQYFIILALSMSGLVFRIARDKMTWTKETVLQDWKELIDTYSLPVTPAVNKNRPDQTYLLNGNEINFIGLDDEQKLHGMKQDYFWLNEAIEASKNDFDQLEMRTTTQAILDYNPSTDSHWIYDAVIPREDCAFVHSTMLDNPFLPETIIKSIRSFEPTQENRSRGTADEIKWKIYGLGQRATLKGLIFTNVNYVKSFPTDCKWIAYGVDFGYTNDPTTIIKCGLWQGELFFEELLYMPGMTNDDIANSLNRIGASRYDEIFADSSEPKSIAEIKKYGFNIKPCEKGPDSIINGIDVLKRYRINITDNSINFRKEQRNYTWQYDERDNKFLNKPIDVFNHCWDAARYCVTMKLKKREAKVYG